MAVKRKKKIDYGKIIKESLINQKRLAQLIGMNEVELSNKMNGFKDFELEDLGAIENVLNIKLLNPE